MIKAKKTILITTLIIFPLLIMCGFATWIILDRTIFAPKYNPNGNSILYNAFDGQNPQSTDYNGTTQGPTSIDSSISNENCIFSYRLSTSNGFYSSGLPMNAGTYDILIKDKNNVYVDDVVQFTINKIEPISLTAPSLDSTTIYEGDSIGLSGGSATGINGQAITGNFSYTNPLGTASLEYIGTESTSNNEVSVTFHPSGEYAKNYLSKTINIPLSMLPVAYIIGSPHKYYGTIEKALNDAISGNIVTVVPPTKDNYHDTSNKVTPDQITYTIHKNCEIKNGVSFVIPTDSKTLSSVTNSSTLDSFINNMKIDDRSRGSTGSYNLFATQNENKYLRVTIHIDDDKVLANNGNLIISGYLSGGNSGACVMGQTSHSYSRILLGNNSKIIQSNDQSNTYCYGYIQETSQNNSSKVEIKKGNLYIPYIVDDYKGFSFSWAMTEGAIDKERCSPFNQFEMRNIYSNVQIDYDAKVYGIINVWVSYSSVGVDKVFTESLNIVGNTNTFAFQLTDQTYSSIIYKFDKTTEVSKVKIYGGMNLNNFKLALNAGIGGVKVDLSTTNAFFPISYRLDIELFASTNQDVANFDITNQRLKLLPGASLTINDKCILKSNELVVYSAFYDGSIGNGQNSQIGTGKNYPIKKGATLKVIDSGKIESNSLAGTIYGNSSNIICTKDTIIAKEAWSIGSSGKVSPAWTIKDFLEIHEKLNIVSLDYFDNKTKIYVGVNTFTNYNSYLPAFDVLVNDGVNRASINEYQQVLFFDSINDYQFDFVSNIFKAYYSSKAYQKNQIIPYNDTNSIIGVVNSVLSISNNNNGVNEFNVQQVNLTCSTPLVNNQIPLYIDSTISLSAEVIDIDKAYNTQINWSSLDSTIATVDKNGNVTGVTLGKTTIQAECDGVIGVFDVEVIEKIDVEDIQSISITDNKGNSTEKVAGTFSGTNYNAQYSNGTNVTFSININPTNAPYSSIKWEFTASAAGRQYVNDKTQQKETIENVSSVLVHIVSGSGKDDDIARLKCTVIALDGKEFSVTFVIDHKADVTCIAEGTLITMADGSQKKVEDLQIGDMVVVFDHETGQWKHSPILVNVHSNKEKEWTNILNLKFDDDTILRIIQDHGLFDIDLNQYVWITVANYKEYLNHHFVSMSYTEGKVVKKEIKLIDAFITNEYINVYSPASVWHLNLIANNLLSLSSGMVNFFEYDENMTYDKQLMQQDIEKYGLYTYDDFKEYVSIEVFNAFPFKYFKVAVGKGLISFEEILLLINYYNESI